MVKRSSKNRARKIDVSDVVSGLAKKAEEKKAQEKLDAGLLFSVDTKGNSQGLPTALRKKLKVVDKTGKKTLPSAHELGRIDKMKKRMENREKQNATYMKKQTSKDSGFDLWAPTGAKVHSSKDVDQFRLKADKEAVESRNSVKDFPTSVIEKKLDPEMHKIEYRNKCSFINLQAGQVQKPKNLPKMLGKTSSLAPAVVVPFKSGVSINPGQQAYDEIVDEIVAKEVSKMDAETEGLRKRKPMTAKLKDHYTDEELKAMDEATKIREYKRLMLKKEGEESGAEESDGEAGCNSDKKLDMQRKKMKPNERKTKAQRNKEKRHAESLKQMSSAKRQKLLEKSIGQIPNLVREIEKENKAKGQEKEYNNSLKQEAIELEKKGIIVNPKKVGRNKFTEEVLDVPQKATSSLRTAQVGSAVKDRLQSLHRRNMGELPPEFNRSTLLRVRKKGKRKTRNHKLSERSLLLA